MPNLVDYLTTLENRVVQEVRGYVTWAFCAHKFMASTTPQQALVYYIEQTQRFLLRPAIEQLLEAVEEAMLTERHLTGEALTRLLRTASRERDA